MWRLDQYITNKNIRRIDRKTDEIPSNTITNPLLVKLLKHLDHNDHPYIYFEKMKSKYYFYSVSASHVSLLTGYVDRGINIPERAVFRLSAVYFNMDGSHAKITEYETFKDELLPEPEIEFTTTILAKTGTLLSILKHARKISSWHFPKVMLLPQDNAQVIIRVIDGDDNQNDYNTPDVRILEGGDPGLYRLDFLHEYIRLFKNLDISMIKIQYAANKPMLITPRNPYPQIRVWIAPAMVSDG